MHGLEGEQMLMRIYIGERDKHDGRPLYEAIVRLLRERHFAGATVLRAIMGFGANARIRTQKVLDLSIDMPIVVECVANLTIMSFRFSAAYAGMCSNCK